MEIPGCMNAKEGSCPKSDTFVSKETDTEFVILCRTCRSVNVWPKSIPEQSGRYQSFLKHKAAREAQERYESMRKEFSFGGDKI